ncbi:unnamed protein product [Polarella glacialis]|uniref:Uncharacterized protein n=1 Tax=Polarella glacialis TaxID=89957 RepID=A0A813D0Y8_POLGL|nr:unnamed protein product [Polarella glacialis]
MAAFFTRPVEGGQALRAFVRLEGFGRCAEITLDVSAGKGLAMLDATWSLVAPHASPAVAPSILAFMSELDQMKAAATAAETAVKTLQLPKPPPPSGPAGVGIGRRKLPAMTSPSCQRERLVIEQPRVVVRNLCPDCQERAMKCPSCQDRMPVPPAPQPPTAPPGHVFKRPFHKTQSSSDVASAGQMSSPSSSPKQSEEDKNSSFGAEKVEVSSNSQFSPGAAISSIRQRIMQHRQCAVLALAELPEIQSQRSSGSSVSSCSSASSCSSLSSEDSCIGCLVDGEPRSPEIAPNSRTLASAEGNNNNAFNKKNNNSLRCDQEEL